MFLFPTAGVASSLQDSVSSEARSLSLVYHFLRSNSAVCLGARQNATTPAVGIRPRRELAADHFGEESPCESYASAHA